MDSSPANNLSPARTRVFDPYGGVLVDEDEDDCSEIVLVPGGRFLLTEHGGLSLWDLGLNTEGARKMTTTMPIAVHPSEDESKLSILGVVPAPECRGLRVIVANGYVPFLLAWWCGRCLRLVDQRPSRYLKFTPQCQSPSFNSLEGCA